MSFCLNKDANTEEETMELELRVVQLERQNRKQQAGLGFLAVLVCALVTVAANHGEFSAERGDFETVRAKNVIAENIYAVNKLGNFVVVIAADDAGDGTILTSRHTTVPGAAAGEDLVEIGSVHGGGGIIGVKNNGGNTVVQVLGHTSGDGQVSAISDNGMQLASMSGAGDTGFISVWNSGENLAAAQMFTDIDGGKFTILNTKEELVVDLHTDENGNGGVWTSAKTR